MSFELTDTVRSQLALIAAELYGWADAKIELASNGDVLVDVPEGDADPFLGSGGNLGHIYTVLPFLHQAVVQQHERIMGRA